MLPASAGMIQFDTAFHTLFHSAPRIRGDDPQAVLSMRVDYKCSPHPRG